MQEVFKKRHEDVLGIIIDEYIQTAEPVGSRLVSKRLDLSSATIRNVMADLEDMGFIMHPHTSAGRVPTDKGYRYYIESLMHIRKVNEVTIRMISDRYRLAMRSLEDVLETTSHLISNLTNYIGITLYPEYEKIYLDGASHIIEQPEFKDFAKIHTLLRYMEEKREILSLLSDDFDTDDLTIHIGRELKHSNLSDCSIVTRGYKVKGKRSGRLGVIGPKRMLYDKVIPTIELLAKTVSNVLDDIEVK
jgi:transcriptional regulator of heat shock response